MITDMHIGYHFIVNVQHNFINMKHITLSLILLFSTSCYAQFKQEVKNVAIFVHEGVELFDFAGPGEVFVAAGFQSPVIDFNVYTVAPTEEQVTSQTFLKIVPNYSIYNCPKPDIIVLPGGATGRVLNENPEVVEWVKKVNEDTDISLSVCTGAFILAKAGLLDGKKATTHWGSIEALKNNYPSIEVLEETKFVDNGKIITSGGVSSGTEGSLHVINRIAGESAAKRVARYMEYNGWDDQRGLVEHESKFITAVQEMGFEKAAAKMKETPVFYGELLNLGLSYYQKNQIEKALPIAEYLATKYPVNETNTLLRDIHKKMGKEVPVSEAELIAMMKQGNIDQAIKTYQRDKQKFPDAFIFEESKFNRAGYRLMSRGKVEDAIKVFEANTMEYPNSFNTWDSLAEAYLKAGNKELAIKYYEKSLALNPENTNAKDILNKINSN